MKAITCKHPHCSLFPAPGSDYCFVHRGSTSSEKVKVKKNLKREAKRE